MTSPGPERPWVWGWPGETGTELSAHRRQELRPLPSPALLCLQTWTIKGREGVVALGITSRLHGRASWWGWVPLQSSAKPPREPRCPCPNQTCCLDAPTPAGTVQRRVLVSSPAPLLGLLDSFAPKSYSFSLDFFFFGGGVSFAFSFSPVSTSLPVSFSLSPCSLPIHPQSLCPFGPPPRPPAHPPSLVTFSICQTNFGSSAFNENKIKGS